MLNQINENVYLKFNFNYSQNKEAQVMMNMKVYLFVNTNGKVQLKKHQIVHGTSFTWLYVDKHWYHTKIKSLINQHQIKHTKVKLLLILEVQQLLLQVIIQRRKTSSELSKYNKFKKNNIINHKPKSIY